jgi:hypothetical protein
MKLSFMTKLVFASTLAASAALATAAPIVNVELFNVNAPNNVATNQAYIANNSPNQKFQLTSLPLISGNSVSNPISIFGSAVVAGSIETITTADPSFDNTLYRFTGFLDLGVTDQVFKIVANDGFLLSIAGTTILTSNTQGTQTKTTSIAAGPQAFELIYWNNANVGSLNFTINGVGITPVNGPTSQIPLPGSLWLVLAGFGVIAMQRRPRTLA